MKLLLLLAALVVGDPWTLRTGPTEVPSIPLKPVQMVPAWRGSYGDSTQTLWVYLTRSPWLAPPTAPGVRSLGRTGWTLVAFFPATWTPAQQRAWVDQWEKSFLSLASLPEPGFPVVFPAVLTKG